MASWAIDRFQDQLLTNTIKILVASAGAIASVDFSLVDGVERAHCASALEGELSGLAGQSANSAAVLGVALFAGTLRTNNDLVSSAGVAIAVAVEEFVALTLTHAKSPLKSFSLRAPTRVSSNHDHGLRANRAEPIHNETVGQLVAGCAHLTRVVGISALADTFATHQLLVASAVGTNSVRGSLSSSRTQGTDSADAAQTRNASTSLSAGVVLFVGSAFLGADTELVGVVSIVAVAVASLGVVD